MRPSRVSEVGELGPQSGTLSDLTLYRSLARQLPNACVLVFDAQLQYLLADGAFLSDFGLLPEAVEGRAVADVHGPESRDALLEAYRATLAGRATSLELRVAGRSFDTYVSPVRDDSGAVVAGIAVGFDVTGRRSEQERHAALIKTVLETIPDAIIVTDPAGRSVMLNEAARARGVVIGEAPDEIITRRQLMDANGSRPLARSELASVRAVAGERFDHFEFSERLPNGALRFSSASGSPLRDENGSVSGAVVVVRDVTSAKVELARERDELRALSLVDELTGLSNRRGFLTLGATVVERAHRDSYSLLLLFADLDGMKRINDTLGHDAGDRALQLAAAALRGALRASDLVARFGGDEFAALVPSADGATEPAVRGRLAARLAKHNADPTKAFELSMSLGAVTLDPDDETPLEELLARADAEMYREKRARGAGRS